jgi:hypothetical protein
MEMTPPDTRQILAHCGEAEKTKNKKCKFIHEPLVGSGKLPNSSSVTINIVKGRLQIVVKFAPLLKIG